jgi:hypothetical protein
LDTSAAAAAIALDITSKEILDHGPGHVAARFEKQWFDACQKIACNPHDRKAPDIVFRPDYKNTSHDRLEYYEAAQEANDLPMPPLEERLTGQFTAFPGSIAALQAEQNARVDKEAGVLYSEAIKAEIADVKEKIDEQRQKESDETLREKTLEITFALCGGNGAAAVSQDDLDQLPAASEQFTARLPSGFFALTPCMDRIYRSMGESKSKGTPLDLTDLKNLVSSARPAQEDVPVSALDRVLNPEAQTAAWKAIEARRAGYVVDMIRKACASSGQLTPAWDEWVGWLPNPNVNLAAYFIGLRGDACTSALADQVIGLNRTNSRLTAAWMNEQAKEILTPQPEPKPDPRDLFPQRQRASPCTRDVTSNSAGISVPHPCR